MKLWIIGAKKLVVKVNAQYIKEILNKLDLYPNVAINRWIMAILMFDFKNEAQGARQTVKEKGNRR